MLGELSLGDVELRGGGGGGGLTRRAAIFHINLCTPSKEGGGGGGRERKTRKNVPDAASAEPCHWIHATVGSTSCLCINYQILTT